MIRDEGTPIKSVPSGIEPLDEILQGIRLGDNVVWQVDSVEDYRFFANPFVRRSLREGRRVVYLRFAAHEPVLSGGTGAETIDLDPTPGFDVFSTEVHQIIADRGPKVFYVFDNLSALVVPWATDELLANFFQVTCPYLYELETVAYFALTRNRHSHRTVARIRDTTQLLINVYNCNGKKYVHPLKAWDRYSPQMFIPHVVTKDGWLPVFASGDAAQVAPPDLERPLDLGNRSIAPWESVCRRLMQYQEMGKALAASSKEIAALKTQFERMMLGSHPRLDPLVTRAFELDDLFRIRYRLIGSGRIGGKAVGMLLARRIVHKRLGERRYTELVEGHDSFYVGSDVFYTFLVNNNLFRRRLQISRRSAISQEEFRELERLFLAGSFPEEVMEQFRDMLEYYGQAPIIIRSSSLLEDNFENAFAGKYRSVFCANQGNPKDRLEAFLKAVKLVYASTLNPDALSYRKRRGLTETDEQMAILVMRVSGTPYRNLFFPTLAGVALSHNLYAWTDRIDPARGLIRLVFGLGTRAVNRESDDYSRLIAVSRPELRPEVGQEIVRYSQRRFDCLDLEKNAFTSLPIADVLGGGDYPGWKYLISVDRGGDVYDPPDIGPAPGEDKPVLTFANLIRRTDFVELLGELCDVLEEAYENPVEMEFTASVRPGAGIKVNILQCRPMYIPGSPGPLAIAEDIPKHRILFRAKRIITGGNIEGIRHIVYVDPKGYQAAPPDKKRTVGRIIGRINDRLEAERGRLIMIGPGRWGTSNVELGVNVSYADIDNTAVLVEVANEEAGHVPDVSYGTHFFQDLVEDQIVYLPVYPADADSDFNPELLAEAPNALPGLLPELEDFSRVVKVVDVPAALGGCLVRVVADPRRQQAVCYLYRD